MKHLYFLTGLLFWAIQSTLFAQGPPVKMDPVLEFANTITPEELEAHLEFLASEELEGRETAQPGQKMAALYLATQFQEIGLQPVVEIGMGKSWYQTYELVRTELGKPTVSIDGKGKKRFALLEDFLAYSVGNLSRDIDEEMVFAGFGIQDERYDNLTGLNLKGKAAVVLSGEPMDPGGNSMITGEALSGWTMNWRKKRTALQEAGATAMIVILEQQAFEDGANSKWVKHSLGGASHQLKYQLDKQKGDFFPTIYISENLGNQLLKSGKLTAQKARTQLARETKVPAIDFKKKRFQLHASVTTSIVTGENVLGYLEGTDKKDEVIILTAHYDHLGVDDGTVYNGADDDGSGTVALLEMAEAFQTAAENGHRPRRSILFMPVSGEEKGLLGSRYYSDHPVLPLENTVTDLNIDMIGRIDKEDDKWKTAEDTNYVYIIGSDMLSTDLHKVSEQAGAAYVPEITLDYRYNDADDPNRFYYRSDHYNFAKKGIPVIFYFTGVHEDYHKPTDTIEKIQFGKMSSIVRLVFATAWEVANREERLKVDQGE